MSENVVRQSAEIYQFPKRGRFAAAARDELVLTAKGARVVKTVRGGAWYHDEAIADEQKP